MNMLIAVSVRNLEIASLNVIAAFVKTTNTANAKPNYHTNITFPTNLSSIPLQLPSRALQIALIEPRHVCVIILSKRKYQNKLYHL